MKTPSTKGRFCKICKNKSSMKPHKGNCKKFYSYVKDTNTCFCGYKNEKLDSLYAHLQRKKCHEKFSKDLQNNYDFESENQLQTSFKIEPDYDPMPVESNLKISAVEGNTTYHSSATNDNMEQQNEAPNDTIPEEIESEHLLDFLKDLDYSDINIYFGNHKFGVHKFFLAKSPIFKDMIDKNEDIRIEKKDHQAAIEALRYLYSVEIPDYKILNSVSGLIAGIKFELKGLKELSERCVQEMQLTETAICDIYQHYEELNGNLLEKIEDFIFTNIDTIWQCDRWCELTTLRPDIMIQLIKSALARKP